MKPKKYLGQNFLKNPDVVTKIIDAAELTEHDLVIEIGPGTGILTDALVKHVKDVWAIEKDYDLSTKLRNLYKNTKKAKIIHQDALLFDTSLLSTGKYKVVANIPYNITSPLIRKFIEHEPRPELMVLMVQKEVAERITAKHGHSERGLLTIIVEYFAAAEIVAQVPRKDFYPMPSVDSAIIKLKVNKDSGNSEEETANFFKIVKAGFSAKRRQIHNSLAATLRIDTEKMRQILSKAQIDSTLRAEDLTLPQWQKLAGVINSHL